MAPPNYPMSMHTQPSHLMKNSNLNTRIPNNGYMPQPPPHMMMNPPPYFNSNMMSYGMPPPHMRPPENSNQNQSKPK